MTEPLHRIHRDFESFSEFLDEFAGRISVFGTFLESSPSTMESGESVVLSFSERGEVLVQACGVVVDSVESANGGVGVIFEVIDPTSHAVLESIEKARRRQGRPVLLPEAEAALRGGGQFDNVATQDIERLLEDLFADQT